MIRKEKIAGLWPLLSAWDGTGSDIRKFEMQGTRSFPAEMAASDAISFHQKIGATAVHARLHHLKTYWTRQLQSVQEIRFHTSTDRKFSAAMATFSLPGRTSAEIAEFLFQADGLHVGTINWNGLDGVRISPHVYTSLHELDRLVAGVKELMRS